ncbi:MULTISPECIES: hypothetical protein [Kitasatospora]|uniref:hypothetical protein n=1 Tax=Kitasatospora TaxID=2063 RepID=UPI001E29E3E4|nr:hypothetical protein [Kitasatospora humi]MCC9309887.1 hypothetical protein [Kitasatospora humi]
MEISPAAQALYMSMHETGALVTPYEVAELRADAVGRLGFNGLRIECTKRALFCAAAEPDHHGDRMRWAVAAAGFVDPQ